MCFIKGLAHRRAHIVNVLASFRLTGDNGSVIRSLLISLLSVTLFLNGLTAGAALANSTVVNPAVPQGMGSTHPPQDGMFDAAIADGPGSSFRSLTSVAASDTTIISRLSVVFLIPYCWATPGPFR